MKISVNELKKFIEIDLSVDELVQKIGAQLGEVEEVIDLGKKYKGIIIAKVIECKKHPNADKLSLCKIDNGKEKIQVVCGAPNVREDLLVAWLPPGATVPATFEKDRLILEAREIRGEISNGMLASASELSLSDDHSGILELASGTPGDDFAKTYGLDDQIIDIENKMFTHRPDCFGLLGVAREIAGIQRRQFKSPDWYSAPSAQPPGTSHQPQAELPIEVRNEIPEVVPRFMAQVVGDVQIQPSPLWLQIYLTKLGIKSINNIVDITNYIMHLTGQPLHAYDYDKLATSNKQQAVSIEVRKSKKGGDLELLNGKKIIFDDNNTILITSDDTPIGIGGVMGGADTEVDQNTKNIILECATFDLYSIRRTSMTHGLFTDAATRFSKGQSSLQNSAVITKAIEEIINQTGGKVAGDLIDINHLNNEVQSRGSVHAPVEVSLQFINSRLGLDLSAEDVIQILRHVEFVVEVTRGEVIVVKAPFWRTDIEIAEDVVEEIGRLYGYDLLPQNLPKRSLAPVGPDNLLQTSASLRQELAKYGANEVLTYSFVHSNLMEKVGQDTTLAYKISNALSPDLQYYRLSLTPNLLEKVHPNIKAGYDQFILFETGKVHGKSEVDEQGLPKELGRIAAVFADKQNKPGAAYYQALAYLNLLIKDKFSETWFEPLADSKLTAHKMFNQMASPFDPKRSAVIYDAKSPLGVIGEFKASVKSKLKLPSQSSGFELFLTPLVKAKLPAYIALSKYPSIEQDICLKTSYKLPYADLLQGLKKSLSTHTPPDITFSVFCIDIFSKDSSAKNTTFRITALSYERTLSTEVVNKLLDKVSQDLKQKLQAERV